MSGFTGIDWDTRTNEQLATDLAHGPGPAPIAEAGLAWVQLSAELAEAGVEFSAILARLGLNWRSSNATPAFAKLTRLAPWFAEASAEAARNGLKAEAQAAAITVARLNMPDLAEVEAAERIRDLALAADGIAPIMAGAGAQAERALHGQRMRAARVMQTYEAATEPVKSPWVSSQKAPDLVSGVPLRAERDARRAAAGTSASPSPETRQATGSGMGAVPWAPGYAVEPAKQRYAPTVVAGGPQSGEAPTPTRPVGTATTPLGAAPPLAPGMMHGAGDRTVVRTVEVGGSGDAGTESTAGPSDEDSTLSWAELATTDRPAVRHFETDPRYDAERLLLGDGAR